MDVIGATEDLRVEAFDASGAQGSALAGGAGAAHPEDTPHSPVPLLPMKVFAGPAAPTALIATAGAEADAEL